MILLFHVSCFMFQKKVAKKSKEKFIWLECSVCHNKNYTSFNSKKQEKKLELKKHCKTCRKHTDHKQVK